MKILKSLAKQRNLPEGICSFNLTSKVFPFFLPCLLHLFLSTLYLKLREKGRERNNE